MTHQMEQLGTIAAKLKTTNIKTWNTTNKYSKEKNCAVITLGNHVEQNKNSGRITVNLSYR